METRMKGLTLGGIVEMDPEVGRILAGVLPSALVPAGSAAYYEEYARVKGRLERRVGWFAWEGAPAALATCQAYDIAMQAALDRMDGVSA